MVYIERNDNGTIIAIHDEPGKNLTEQKSIIDEEILEFLNTGNDTDGYSNLLSLSDHGIIRIVEDLINLLVKKNIIHFTELPQDAQEKLINRKQLRNELGKKSIILESDDIL